MQRVLVVGDQAAARTLRDEGAEVVYLETITDAAVDAQHLALIAVQEDVASVVTTGDEALTQALTRALAQLDATDIAVVRAGESSLTPGRAQAAGD